MTERVSLKIGHVMALMIAPVVPMRMKLSVLPVHSSFFVQMAGVQTWKESVMGQITVGMAATKIKSVSVSCDKE